MFINRLTRDAVVLAAGLLMIAIVRVVGRELGWLLIGVPSVVLLPVFVVAGMARSYRSAVVTIRVIQWLVLVPLVIVLWEAWPYAIPQAVMSVLGFAALRSRGNDESRVAGSVAAASTVPAILGLCFAPTQPITLLVVVLFVCGLVWQRTARLESPIPRALVIHAA